MKTAKSLLVLTLIIWSSLTYSFSTACIGKDKPLPPEPRTYTDSDGNTHDTDAFKAWKDTYGAQKQNYSCCDKLEMNATTRVCEDKSMVDSALNKCGSHDECSGDLGCFKFRDEDMFNEEAAANSSQESNALENQQNFELQQDQVEEPKAVGGNCYRNMECDSYKCENFKCVENKICRLADLGDPSSPDRVKCEAPLKKNSQGKCVSADLSYYPGLLGEIIVGTARGVKLANGTTADVSKNQCQFELFPTAPNLTPEHVTQAANLGIATTRAMEWLFSQATQNKDCVFAVDYIREQMKAKVEIRKDILKTFNDNMLLIETNFALVNAAVKDNQTQLTTLCGDTTTQHDVFMRKATGLDFLCYMRERNNLFKLYEADMLRWTAEVEGVINTYASDVFAWSDDQKSGWTMAGQSYDFKSRYCRYYVDLLVGVLTPKKMKKRWMERYKVPSNNHSVLSTPMVSKYLGLMDSVAVTELKKKHYMLDPLLSGASDSGVNFQKYGNKRIPGAIRYASAVLTGGISLMANDPKHDRTLNEGYDPVYADMEQSFYKYLRGLRTATPEADFILEPEIPSSYETRGCLSNLNNPECERFKKYTNTIKDVAFAQMLAYSYHKQKKYKHYYKSEFNSLRTKLWNRYNTDLTNLKKYYGALGDLRTKQNACIDKVIAQLQSPDFDGEGQGVTQGAGNYYNSTETNYVGTNSSGPDYNKPKIKTKSQGSPFKFNLSKYHTSLKDGHGLSDAIGNGKNAGSGEIGQGSVSAAASVKKMLDANAAAAAKGLDVAKEEKDFLDKLGGAGILASAGAAVPSFRGGSAGALSGAGDLGNIATSVGDKAEGDKDAAKKSGAGNAITAGAGGGANVGALTGSVAGSGSGSDSAATAGAGDPTGMSDEEKDRMSANYDRTKGEYKTNEDDSLFQVLSKTYVRNLDKILIRKKKLDEDAASFPSEPSKP